MAILSEPLLAKRQQLLELLRGLDRCVIAFSGGVDSGVLAKAAQIALGDRAVAVTGNSLSLAEGELESAKELAQRIGIRHEVVSTEEQSNPAYTANAPDRCFHCKDELYTQLTSLAQAYQGAIILNGANADDLGDYRPGLRAASEHSVRSPLAECGLHKAEIRQLAAEWSLPVADKPAMPCLASRIAYGEAVTPERLHRIDQAEQLIRSLGIRNVRVRHHADDIARIEVPVEELAELCQPAIRSAIAEELHRLGFKFVTLDLEGFRSGSLNSLISIDGLER